MREYKYRELLLGRETWEPLMEGLKRVRSDCLKDCAEAFRTNMERIVAFAIAPAALVSEARREALYSEGAVLRAIKTGDISVDDALVHKTTLGIQADIQKLNADFLQSTDKHHRYFDVLGLQYIEAILDQRRPDGQPMAMHDAMEAILAFVILGSWTAFESLAGDLWVAGVDNDTGQSVANLTIASVSNKLKKPDDNLRPVTVYKSGINPKTNYGSFLRAIGSVTFQTLRDIKTYYEIAFGAETLQLFDEIENGYIEVLAAFRNAITHSSGRADKKFVDRIHGRFPQFDHIREKDLLQPDGELANTLSTVAAKLGAALIAHIDDSLTPPKNN